MPKRPLQCQSHQLARLVCRNTLRVRLQASQVAHLRKVMGETQVFLDVNIPVIQMCADSAVCLHLLLQHPDKAGREEIQESFLTGPWVSTRTHKNSNLNSRLLPRHYE